MIDTSNLTEEQETLIIAGALTAAAYGLQGLSPGEAIAETSRYLTKVPIATGNAPTSELTALLKYLRQGNVPEVAEAAKQAEDRTIAREALREKSERKELAQLPLDVRRALVEGAACFDALALTLGRGAKDQTSALIGTAFCAVLEVPLPSCSRPDTLGRKLATATMDYLAESGAVKLSEKDPWDGIRGTIAATKGIANALRSEMQALASAGEELEEELGEEKMPEPHNPEDLN